MLSTILYISVGIFIAFALYSVIRSTCDDEYYDKMMKREKDLKEKADFRKSKPSHITDKAFRKYCRTGDRRYLYKDGFKDI